MDKVTGILGGVFTEEFQDFGVILDVIDIGAALALENSVNELTGGIECHQRSDGEGEVFRQLAEFFDITQE